MGTELRGLTASPMKHISAMVAIAVAVAGVTLVPVASANAARPGLEKHCQQAKFWEKHSKACDAVPTGIKGATAALDASDLAKLVAEMAGKEIGKEAGGFLFSQLGLGDLSKPNSGDFADIKNRLDVLSGQVQTLQNSTDDIDKELGKIHLDQYTQPMLTDVSGIESLWKEFFHRVLVDLDAYITDALALKNGQACNVDPCKQHLANYQKDLNTFLGEVSHLPATQLNIDIHNRLIPIGGDSVLIAYGKVLMNTTGFLTRLDSDNLLAFYHYYSGWEALAVWMKAEWKAIQDETNPQDFADFVADQVSGPCPPPRTGDCGFFDLEKKAMPAMIPSDAMIALPAHPEQRKTTLGQPMWLWNAKVEPNRTWNPSWPVTLKSSVPAAIDTLNTTDAGLGFTDWRVPSAADLAALFGGRTDYAGLTGVRFLDTILPDSGLSFHPILGIALQDHPFLWTSTPPTPTPCNMPLGGGGFTNVGNITNYAHTGLLISSKLADYPSKFTLTTVPTGVASTSLTVSGNINTVAGALQWCRDTMAARVTAGFTNYAAAQLLAIRTSTRDYMPAP